MEKFKKEVQDYLTKVSNHTYKSDDKYMKVIIRDEKFIVLEWSKYHNKYTTYELSVDSKVNYHKGNAKCITSHQLFLNKPTISGPKYFSVRQTKYVKKEIIDILRELGL
jgi:hypothetical protein